MESTRVWSHTDLDLNNESASYLLCETEKIVKSPNTCLIFFIYKVGLKKSTFKVIFFLFLMRIRTKNLFVLEEKIKNFTTPAAFSVCLFLIKRRILLFWLERMRPWKSQKSWGRLWTPTRQGQRGQLSLSHLESRNQERL